MPQCTLCSSCVTGADQAMEDGSVEMVAAHSHTEQEYLSALADGTPRQHQRFRGFASLSWASALQLIDFYFQRERGRWGAWSPKWP